MRIQDYFNLPSIQSIQTVFPSVDDSLEALTDLKRQWHRNLVGNLTQIITRTSEVKLNPNLFWEAYEAITNPSLYNADFLVSTMSPFPALRPLWEFLTGISNVQWRRDFYEVKTLLRLLPLDVVAMWLQLKASKKFYREYQVIYQPILEDYPEKASKYLLKGRVTLPVVGPFDPLEGLRMSAMEYLDRSFLGAGGLLADFKRLALPGSTVIQCIGSFEGKEVLTPPLGLEATDYLTQLINGRILPYHYPKILEEYAYADSTQSSLGIGANPDKAHQRK